MNAPKPQVDWFTDGLRLWDSKKPEHAMEIGKDGDRVSFFIDSTVQQGSFGTEYAEPVSISLEDAKKAHVELGKLIAELEG